MKKTKIKFEDIKAGDLLEVILKEDGVKSVVSGIAFEQDELKISDRPIQVWWKTSEGGMIVTNLEEAFEGAEIWRIDVTPVKFEDVKQGDLLSVSRKEDDTEVTVTGRAAHVSTHTSNNYWLTAYGRVLCHRLGEQTIEILDRKSE